MVNTANRFEISTEGMRALHEGRPLWQLVKELVANSWDENITACVVSIQGAGHGLIRIAVEDDGPGFTDIADAYTLMAPTPKRGNPEVRGRFNIGEKELISVARSAEVTTVGHTVTFPETGGRKVRRNDRTQGTVVVATVKGRQQEIEPTVEMLRKFLRPDGVTYIVNGVTVSQQNRLHRTQGPLRTVLASGAGEPIRSTVRKTTIDIYEPRGEQGYLYEMGVPIQPIDSPYDVDIAQKVPLPPNRDVVSTAYLQDVYAEVLAVTAPELPAAQISEGWVQSAVEDDRTTDDTVETIMAKKLGPNAVLWSPDQQANERAYEKGFDIIHPRTLSSQERERYKDVGLDTTHSMFGQVSGGQLAPELEPTEPMAAVGRYAQWLALELLGIHISVIHISQMGVKPGAMYGGMTLTFNKVHLGGNWFENAPTPSQTGLILHELAHHMPSKGTHTGGYVINLDTLAGRAVHLAIAMQGRWWTPETPINW